MRLPPPPELDEILDSLPPGWQLVAYKHLSTGWEARLQFRRRTFDLSANRGGMDVYEIVKGKQHQLTPLGDQRMFLKPAHVWQMLLATTGDHNRPRRLQFAILLSLLIIALGAAVFAWFGVKR